MKQTCHAIRLIFLAFGLGISAWAPLIPILKSRLELGDAELGMTLFVFGIGALLMMPLTGWLINKVGSRLIILVFGLGMIVTMPFLPMAPTFLFLSIILFFFGMTTGAMNVSMNAQSVEIEIACQSPILSGVHCWFSIGGLIGAALVSSLIALDFKLPYCMLVISCIIATILVTQFPRLLPFQQSYEGSKTNCKRFGFASKQVLVLGGLCFIAFMAEGSMLDWSAEYLHSEMHYDISTAGIGYAIFSIAMASGRFIGDRMIQKLGSMQVFQLGCLAAACGFLMVVFSPWHYCELLGFCLVGLGASNVVPILFGYSGKIPGVSSDSALTMITTCGYMGLLFGPALIGFVAQATNLSFALSIIAILLVFIGLTGKSAFPAPKNTEPSKIFYTG